MSGRALIGVDRRVAPWLLLLTVLVFGPLLTGGGYWLFGDMVFVPRQPWKDAWLGLDGSLPRAVPMDAVVSATTYLVPGWLVQRVLLVGGYLIGGLGVNRLVRGHGTAARCAAVSLFLWNPWVLERLQMGQWAILLGYLVLPWVVISASAARVGSGRPGHAPGHTLGPVWLALAASAVCSPSSGVMAVAVAVVVGTRRGEGAWRSGGSLLGLGVLANLPWLVPALLSPASPGSPGASFDAFAARAESSAGTLASLLSMGGTWKSSIVPGERESALIVLLSCGLTLVALIGLRWRPARSTTTGPLAVVAAMSLLTAILPTLPGGTSTLEWMADRVPALALLRDSHRYLAPAVLLLLPGIAGAVDAMVGRARQGRWGVWSAVALAVVAPLVLLPSLVWGGFGTTPRSTYPPTWDRIADVLADRRDSGAVVVLPWAGPYRAFSWNGGRAVLDPAPRYLPGDVVVDDRIVVDDTTLPSEDPRVGAVTTALDASDPAAELRDLGFRWVLVEGAAVPGAWPTGQVVVAGDGLELVDLGTPTMRRGVSTPHRLIVVGTDVGVTVITILLFVGQMYILLSTQRDRRHGGQPRRGERHT